MYLHRRGVRQSVSLSLKRQDSLGGNVLGNELQTSTPESTYLPPYPSKAGLLGLSIFDGHLFQQDGRRCVVSEEAYCSSKE